MGDSSDSSGSGADDISGGGLGKDGSPTGAGGLGGPGLDNSAMDYKFIIRVAIITIAISLATKMLQLL
jgi:hypothetical protein